MLAALLTLLGCADDPCAGHPGARLRVAPPAADEPSDPRDFTSISAALALAEPGAAVCVAPGVYREKVRIEAAGVRLLGAGPDLTIIEPSFAAEDPSEGEETVVAILGDDAELRGFTVRGGARGVWVDAGRSATLGELRITDNAAGLLAIDPGALRLENVEIVQNASVGALIVSTRPGPELVLDGGRVAGNGSGGSEVGGIYSERGVQLLDVELRDNAGSLAADLYTPGHLTVAGGLVARPYAPGAAPRLYAGDGAALSRLHARTAGAPLLRVECGGSSEFEAQNLAIADAVGDTPALRIGDCDARLDHLTLVNQAGSAAVPPIAVEGGGSVELNHAALLGWSPVEDWPEGREAVRVRGSFSGSIAEARLLAPLDAEPDLRPQPDSPLIDAALSSTTSSDIDGRPRPIGGAADQGAYEMP